MKKQSRLRLLRILSVALLLLGAVTSCSFVFLFESNVKLDNLMWFIDTVWLVPVILFFYNMILFTEELSFKRKAIYEILFWLETVITVLLVGALLIFLDEKYALFQEIGSGYFTWQKAVYGRIEVEDFILILAGYLALLGVSLLLSLLYRLFKKRGVFEFRARKWGKEKIQKICFVLLIVAYAIVFVFVSLQIKDVGVLASVFPLAWADLIFVISILTAVILFVYNQVLYGQSVWRCIVMNVIFIMLMYIAALVTIYFYYASVIAYKPRPITYLMDGNDVVWYFFMVFWIPINYGLSIVLSLLTSAVRKLIATIRKKREARSVSCNE